MGLRWVIVLVKQSDNAGRILLFKALWNSLKEDLPAEYEMFIVNSL